MPTAKFNKPPLNEVVIGVHFAPIKGLRSQHIGRFWEKFADRYPKSEQAPNYGEMLPLEKGEVYPAPRFWFITKALDRLVQIQSNLFLCNWRKVDGEGTYPEYGEMRKVFKENYSLFLKFLKDEGFQEPVPIEYQFAYINHFYEGREWKRFSDLPKIIKSLSFPATQENQELTGFDLNYWCKFPDENKGAFRMKFSSAKSKITDQQIIIFENSARGLDAENDDIYQWFDYAHEQLVNNFEKLTDAKMQKALWEKQ